ncbi:MAG: phosphate acyltransferase [Flavonifractor plautii]
METNLCVAGFGGQGVMTLGKFLADATCNSTDKNVTFFPSYGAEQRGGTANCFVVISDEAIGAPLGDVMDDLIVMNGPSLKKFIGTLKSGGTLFINSSIVSDDIGRDDVKLVKAPVTELALEMGNAKVLNVIMLGVYVGYTEVIDPAIVWQTIEHKLSSKPKLLPSTSRPLRRAWSWAAPRSSKEEFGMVFHNFDELIAHVKGQPSRARMAVAAAGDAHTIEAVLRARAEGIVTPILVGDKAVIDQVLAELGEHIPAEDIHDEPDLAEAARKAVALVRAGEADFLMKGKLDTSVLLKAVVNKETGLGKGGVMSHFTAFEIPTYHKSLMPVDGGMVTYPTLEQKKAIIENTVGALRAMGYDCPKVGVLACVEKLNPKMPETVEGDALKQMNQRGELTGCVVEGPISYDCAVSREIAAFKGFESPCA